MSRETFLRTVPLLSGLSSADLQQLASIVEERLYPAGAILFAEGQMADMAFIIQTGEVQIQKSGPEGHVLLATRGSSEVIGEMALLDSAPRMASAVTTCETNILTISQNQFKTLLTDSPEAAYTVLQMVVARWRETESALNLTMEELTNAQRELVQSEKMAMLGQLLAGVAHEINTPLGVIRSSGGNVQKALVEVRQNLPQLIAQLDEAQLTDFFTLLTLANPNELALTSREKRKKKRALRAELEARAVVSARIVADKLVDMGIHTVPEPLLPLLVLPERELILQQAYNFVRMGMNNNNVLTAVERASKIVFALKNYSRYGGNDDKIMSNITEGIDTVLTLYHNQLKHAVEVFTHYDELPETLCYPDELNQVWTNLIHNALQAMNFKGQLDITASQQAETIMVQVTDNGCGIPADIQDRIFEPFFTTKPQGEGSGLGLDISRQIIEKHDGHIWVESQPGKTTFTVSLPIVIV